MQLADDFSSGDVEGRKQRRSTMAAVVVRASFGQTGHHRQNRLHVIQRLNLALLVHALHQRSIGRVQVQPHDVAHLLSEQRIGGQLEGLSSVWLQTTGAPDAHHGALRQAAARRRRSAAPVRGGARLLVQGLGNDLLNHRIADGARRAGTRLIEQTTEPSAVKAPAPLAHRLRCDAQLSRNLVHVASHLPRRSSLRLDIEDA